MPANGILSRYRRIDQRELVLRPRFDSLAGSGGIWG